MRRLAGPDAVWIVTVSPTSAPIALAMFFAITVTAAPSVSSPGVNHRPSTTFRSNIGRGGSPHADASLPSAFTMFMSTGRAVATPGVVRIRRSA